MQDATRVSRMTSRWVGDEAEAAVANDVDVHLTPEDVRRRCWRHPWRPVVAAIVSILCCLPFIAEDESKSRLGVPFLSYGIYWESLRHGRLGSVRRADDNRIDVRHRK